MNEEMAAKRFENGNTWDNFYLALEQNEKKLDSNVWVAKSAFWFSCSSFKLTLSCSLTATDS